ncbi:hypothetical protein [Cypionkella sinensis]|uniref:Glyoxalase n=1 Tax=Cypionkella sinensis TaxID=1756043 RepID=A0ABV7IYS5_9RHOB
MPLGSDLGEPLVKLGTFRKSIILLPIECHLEGDVIKAMHHIQLAMPKGGEDQARRIYIEALGFKEVDKPSILQGRGGVWFSQAGVEVHL